MLNDLSIIMPSGCAFGLCRQYERNSHMAYRPCWRNSAKRLSAQTKACCAAILSLMFSSWCILNRSVFVHYRERGRCFSKSLPAGSGFGSKLLSHSFSLEALPHQRGYGRISSLYSVTKVVKDSSARVIRPRLLLAGRALLRDLIGLFELYQ